MVSLFSTLRTRGVNVALLSFCFKQKTAYEMRISDWSSDVCSSDLIGIDLFLVGDAVLAGGEAAELVDGGAGDEGLAAGATQHGDADSVTGRQRPAGLGQLFVHLPGHGVARGRPVEGDMGDRPVEDECDLAVCRRAAHGAKAPFARRSAAAAASMPISSRIASVCSPSSGGWRRTCCGVPDSFTAKHILGTVPST